MDDSITELSLVNITIPLASEEFGLYHNSLIIGEIQNVSNYGLNGCTTIQQAKLAWFHFENVTTVTFAQNDVPSFNYTLLPQGK